MATITHVPADADYVAARERRRWFDGVGIYLIIVAFAATVLASL